MPERFVRIALLLCHRSRCVVGMRVGRSHVQRRRNKTKKSDSSPAPVAVTVAAVRRDTIRQTLVLNGSLEAASTFILEPEVGGQLINMQVDIGDQVQRDAVVARIDAKLIIATQWSKQKPLSR